MTLALRHRIAGAACAALGLALTAAPTLAQPAYDDTTVGEMTVYAPPNLGRSGIGARIERYTSQRVVLISDLDLATPWGRDALRGRIEAAAWDACGELDAIHSPLDLNHIALDPSRDCVTAAVRDATRRAEFETGYQLASY